MRLWLMWASTVIALLVGSMFFHMRQGIATKRLQSDVAVIRAIVLIFVEHWGQDGQAIRSALDRWARSNHHAGSV